jgi:signal peptidase I
MARKARPQQVKGENGDSETTAESGAEPRKKQSALQEWMKSILVAFLLFIFIKTFLLQTFVIISGSMEDTLLVGDMLVANRLAIGARIPGTQAHIPGYSEPHRGDVMIFDPHHEEDMKIVKRIVGLPGDTLAMHQGVLLVNGMEQEDPYLNPATGTDHTSPDFEWQRGYLTSDVDAASYSPSLHNWGPLAVPADHYFMMGDNRDASLDSRFWGFLEGWRLEARVSFLYFSYNSESYRPFPALREIRWNRLGRSLRALSGG